MDAILNYLKSIDPATLIAWGWKVLAALLIFVIGRWVARMIVRAVSKIMEKRGLDPMLVTFLGAILNAILLVAVIIAAVGQLGIQTTPLVAVLGAAGLAVGLALQGSLGNFAGGVLILIFKPFKVGDTIEAQGYLGAVREITILYTIVDTFDNRRIVIPNGSLSNATLVNVSFYDTRRCDMTFGISYSDDIDKARAVIKQLLDEDERVLPEPAPRISVGSLGDNSVNIIVRPWTKTDDLWPVYWDMHERVKKAFDKEDITIPFPQRDVHLYKHE